MSIRRQIILLIALSLFATISIIGYAIYQSRINTFEVKNVTDSVFPSELATADLISHVKEVQLITIALVTAPDANLVFQTNEKLIASKIKLQQGIDFQFQHAANQVQQGLVQQAKDSLADYFRAIDETVRNKNSGNLALAEANYYANIIVFQRELQQIVETLRIEKKRAKDDNISELKQNLSKTTIFLSVGWLITIIVLAVAGIILFRRIINPIDSVKTLLTSSEANSYPRSLPVTRQDEIGILIGCFNNLLDKIHSSEGRLQLAMNAAGQGWFDINLLSGKADVSADYIRMIGFDPAEFITDLANWINSIHPDDLDAFTCAFQECITNGGPVLMEYRRQTKSGGWLWIQSVGKIVHWDVEQKAVQMIGIHTNITERKISEAEMRIAATAFEAQEGLMITDANKVILRVNSAFTEITGFDSEDVIGQTPRILDSDRHDANFYLNMWKKIDETGSWTGEVLNQRKNGEVYPEQLTITAVRNSQKIITNYVAGMSDITFKKQAEKEIENLAFYDFLTGLPNRRLLHERIKHAFSASSRSGLYGALLIIDLDNFKNLNDTLGHDIGDILLQQVANRLASCIREGDTIARLGGDEFVVVLENLSAQPLEAAAFTEIACDKILSILNQPYLLATFEHRNSPSIGAALFNDTLQSIDTLMKQADIAMYQSKKAGKNRLSFFDPQMQDAINTRTALEKDLRTAIENHEFQLYYQIQVDSSHHRPFGAEALIRWIHPERGLISPADFIPVAEDIGLINSIGLWVLKTACAQIKLWQNEPQFCNLILSVNVSAKQFHQADFINQVITTIQFFDINPKLLKLELTEGMLLENIEATIAIMTTLRAAGISFSLDDFGTGYSSLSYLSRLPLEYLKIDRSFVMNLGAEDDSLVICSAIISMAHSLKMKVVAEGIENETQNYILSRVHNCDYLQGYLFSKPVPVEQFEALLKLA